MASPVRVGTTRIGRASSGPGAQVYPGTTSGYGPTRGDSIGANPSNPQAYSASQAAKAYSSSRTQVIAPPIKGTS